jgi:hypothetical protein
MKRNIFHAFFVCISVCFFSSCEDMVTNVDVPDYKPKLVVFSYISPSDTLITVKVKKSVAVYGAQVQDPEEYTVTNATVVISDGEQSVTIPYFEHYNGEDVDAYIVSQQLFPIVAGRTYTMHVTSPGGFDVQSHCTVPEIPTNEVLIDKVDSIQNWDVWMYQVSLHLKDIQGKDNYYRVMADYLNIDPFTQEKYYQMVPFEIGDELLRDAGKDGDNFAYLTDHFSVTEIGEPNFFVTVLAVDENYYTFHKEADMAGTGDDGPFSEPVVLMSNIEGGLGLFAAYHKRVYPFTVTK